jgi:hypothetical protein
MEQLCLKSFVDQGQKITLFHYEPISNVPQGVICRDGREVIDTDDFIKYEKKNSFALFADLFRLHMIWKCHGMIWIDTDVYCQRPLDYKDDYVMGYELPDSQRVNNAVLGLPSDSPMLMTMLDFTADRYSIASFLAKKHQTQFAEARDAGKPVHVSQQPWGVWGPMMVTYYVQHFELNYRVQPLDAFYPATFRERTLFNKKIKHLDGKITDRTTAMHVWASNKRELGNRHLGLPPKGSWWRKACRLHDINAPLAPISSRNTTTFDVALLDTIPFVEGSFIDVGGHSPALAISLCARDNCAVDVVDIDARGDFGNRAEELDVYVKTLVDHGVPRDNIRIVEKQGDIAPADVILNLRNFGDQAKIKHLVPVLKRGMHSDTQLFLDIRKGSGAFPFLKVFGTTKILENLDAATLHRVVMRPNPPEPEQENEWPHIAKRLAGTDGFFHDGPNSHSFLFMPRDPDTLIVTFDNLDIAMNKREDRRPWGYEFIEKQGWSMLGVLAGGWTWYREPWVSAQFDQLRDDGFFNRFRRVVFYGASMGGYAAAAFSAACPGADVVAISPQSTLDKTLVPFETRYHKAWGFDYSGPYGDAPQVSAAARNITIFFDPYEPLDAGHAARFTGQNVTKLRCPLMGHRLGSSLSQMGILSNTILSALSGDLEPVDFYTNLRKRHQFPRYQRELFKRAVARGRPDLARRVGQWVLARGDNRAIRLGMADLGEDYIGT